MNLKNAEKLKQLPWFLGSYVFLLTLSLILAGIIFGIIVFYAYAILPEGKKYQSAETPLKFKESMYNDILTEWQKRKQKSAVNLEEDIKNPFQESAK